MKTYRGRNKMFEERETTCHHSFYFRELEVAWDTSKLGVRVTWSVPSRPPRDQTFLLKVIKQRTDGTTSVIKSVPCDAGSAKDVCVAEVS